MAYIRECLPRIILKLKQNVENRQSLITSKLSRWNLDLVFRYISLFIVVIVIAQKNPIRLPLFCKTFISIDKVTCRARALDITSYLNRFLHFSSDGDKHTYSVKDWQCVVPENIHNPHGKQRKFWGEGGGDKKEAISKGVGDSLSSRGFYFFRGLRVRLMSKLSLILPLIGVSKPKLL